MGQLPAATPHATHDLELVAAYAAGDAAGAPLGTATALVASCPDCAALHHDLRAIAAALPSMPAPARPRDFRLTPEQAAALRPRGWRGVLAAFAGPSFRFAAPLGTGLATLGLAGLLLGSFAGSPFLGAATAGTGAAAPAPAADSNATLGPAKQAASAAPSVVERTTGQTESSLPAGALAIGSAAPWAYSVSSPTITQQAPAVDSSSVRPIGGDGTPPFQPLALLALAVGAVLVAGRLAARRLTGHG